MTISFKRGRKAKQLEKYIKYKLGVDAIAWYEPINGPCIEMQGYEGGWYYSEDLKNPNFGEPLGYNLREAMEMIDLIWKMSLSDRCKSYTKYRGIHKPTCCNGKGCLTCWDRWENKNRT